MKAREIKKSLLNRHHKCITNYATVQAEHIVKLQMLKTQIKVLENMLDNYFGVSKNYFDEETKIEAHYSKHWDHNTTVVFFITHIIEFNNWNWGC